MKADILNNPFACRAAKVAALLALLGVAAGCESIHKADRYLDRQWASPSHTLPPERIAITVRKEATSTTVTFAPRAAAFAPHERDLLGRFIARSGAQRGDHAVIALSTVTGRGLAQRRAQLIARRLHRYGIGVTRSFGPGEPDTAIVTISRLVAVAPDCPQWRTLLQRSEVDEYKPKLGCLNASSLAASVHRPLDLVSGRPSGPSDGVVMHNGVQALREGKFDPALGATGTGSPQAGTTGQQAK